MANIIIHPSGVTGNLLPHIVFDGGAADKFQLNVLNDPAGSIRFSSSTQSD